MTQALPDDEPIIARHGLGYRGLFDADRVLLNLNQLQTSRGDLTGMLAVSVNGVYLFRGRFNASSLTARTSTAKFLRERSPKLAWVDFLETFCWHVLAMDEEGPEARLLGTIQRREVVETQCGPLFPVNAATIVYGPGETGKSVFAAAVGVSIQSGTPLFDEWAPIRQTGVMVLDWEADFEDWNDRVIMLADGLGIEPPAITYRACDHKLSRMVEALSASIERDRIGFIIIDSVAAAQGPSGEGADAGDATNRMFDAVRALGVTTLLIDHVKSDDLEGTPGPSKPYGSVYKMNRARSVYELRQEPNPRLKEAPELALIHRKYNAGPRQGAFGLQYVFGTGTILIRPTAITSPELTVQSMTLAQRMEAALAAEPMLEADLADLLDVQRAAIRKALQRSRGKLIRLPDHRIAVSQVPFL